jgi:hypothetical protein
MLAIVRFAVQVAGFVTLDLQMEVAMRIAGARSA